MHLDWSTSHLLASSILRFFSSRGQGHLDMMTATPSCSRAPFMALVAALTSYGSTSSTYFTPIPRTSFSMSMGSVCMPPNSLPVPGLGWCPVMAVVRLSRMTMMILWSLNSAFTSAGTPAWKNVESPMKAMGVWSVAAANPPAAPAPPPMQMMKSAVWNGDATPKV